MSKQNLNKPLLVKRNRTMMRRLIAALLRNKNGHICKVALAPLPGHPVRSGMTVNPVQLLGFDHA